MTNFAIIVLLLVMAFISLLVVSFVNRRQVRARVINQKLSQMKRRMAEVEELSSSLESLVEDPAIVQIVMDEALDMMDNMLILSPSNEYIEFQRDSAQKRKEELSSGIRAELNRVMDSDAGIARAQHLLTEAARILQRRQNAELVSPAEAASIMKELNWSSFMIKLVTHVAQGHKALNRGDNLRGPAFYKKAKELATQATVKDERMSSLITELVELSQGKRVALSPHLMPETMHNPEPQKKPRGESHDKTQDDGSSTTDSQNHSGSAGIQA